MMKGNRTKRKYPAKQNPQETSRLQRGKQVEGWQGKSLSKHN